MASFVLPIISGLAGLFGGNSTKTTNTNSSFNNASNTNTSGSTTPNLSPLQQSLSNMFGGQSETMANNTGNLLNGYTASGLQNINQAGQAQTSVLNNVLASRGLANSPDAATANTMNTENQLNQSQQLLSSIPLLQRQLQQQNIAQLQGAFSALPTGVSTTGTSASTNSGTGQQQQTTTTPGGGLAGLFAGLGGGLAAPNGSGTGSNLNTILASVGFGPNAFGNSNSPVTGGTLPSLGAVSGPATVGQY
jgi:hypothetical protein